MLDTEKLTFISSSETTAQLTVILGFKLDDQCQSLRGLRRFRQLPELRSPTFLLMHRALNESIKARVVGPLCSNAMELVRSDGNISQPFRYPTASAQVMWTATGFSIQTFTLQHQLRSRRYYTTRPPLSTKQCPGKRRACLICQTS